MDKAIGEWCHLVVQRALQQADETLPTLGAWVRERRHALQQTQADLALRVPCSLALIRKIERGERTPSESVARRLALALQLDAADHEIFIRVARGRAGADMLPQAHPHQLRLLPAARPIALPSALDPILGRDTAIDRLVALLSARDTRLVTLVGAAGVGKTRLAIACADAARAHFPDGVCFVDLGRLDDPAHIPAAIAAAAGIAERNSTLAQIASALITRRMLLLLDNCEHLLDGIAAVAALLHATQRIVALVTSRTPLRLHGERVFTVAPLDSAPAAELFRQRAPVGPLALLPSDVVALVQQLDGLPLAIELARRAADRLRQPSCCSCCGCGAGRSISSRAACAMHSAISKHCATQSCGAFACSPHPPGACSRN
jgi:transcriptional regulator with XRE-family HTH domain